MPSRKPLVFSTSQIEQLPSSDFVYLGKLNIGPSQLIIVTTSVISVSKSHYELNSSSVTNVDTINGGDTNDLLYLRGTIGTSMIKVRKGRDNILGGADRKITGPFDVLVLLKIDGNNWTEVSWSG